MKARPGSWLARFYWVFVCPVIRHRLTVYRLRGECQRCWRVYELQGMKRL